MDENPIRQAAEWVRSAEKVVALTGAGISVESGIPDFRGAGGLWSKYDPMEFAHIEAFLRDPSKVWRMLLELDGLIRDARPNAAHYALARLEKTARFGAVITQNVDNLHQEAGSTRVIEFHGNAMRLRCLGCGAVTRRDEVDMDRLPPRCACGGLIKPDVVFFGEPIPQEAYGAAVREAETCALMLVVGTSAAVAPASSIPFLAKEGGAKVVEINPEVTPLTGTVADLSIHESAGKVLPRLVELAERMGKG